MKKAILPAILALLLPATSPGIGQGVRGTSLNHTMNQVNNGGACPSPVAVVTGFLGFSDAQASQFQQLLQGFLTTVQNLEQQKQVQQQLLDQLLSAPNPNPAAIGAVVLQIHALDVQVGNAVNAFHQAFLGLLTPDQLQKVEAVSQASQLQPVVGAFVALYLVPPPPSAQQP